MYFTYMCGFVISFLQTVFVLSLDYLRLCSHLVPGHGARVRYSLGTNVNTPFFQVPTPEFGHGAGARVQGRDLVLGH